MFLVPDSGVAVLVVFACNSTFSRAQSSQIQ